MDIFYLKKSEFIPRVENNSLLTFSDGRKFNSEEKEAEHLCGIFLTKFIAKNIFDIKNPQIEIINNKPYFTKRQMFFSISHSNDIVLVVFNSSNVGADIEYMQERDYKSIMKRYMDNVENPGKEYFYRFWTLKEAEFKLGAETKSIFSKIFENNYMLTCVADDILVSNLYIRKLTFNKKNIDLTKEFQNPSNLKFQT